MSIVIIVLLFLLGIVLIVKGGDFFVDAASWLAEISGIPKFIVGATIVSIATTLPEQIVSVIAAVQGHATGNVGKVDMAIGNAVGSVTANVGLIMGISIVCIPAVIKRSSIVFKAILLLIAAALLTLFCADNSFSVIEGIILLVFFIVFIIQNVKEAKDSVSNSQNKAEKPSGKVIAINLAKFIFGAAAIVWGADLLVDNGSEIARLIGVPESIIGVTMIAIGTSLPELVTTITAIAKKQSSLSIGNIIGANIIDLTVILPACSIIFSGNLPVGKQSLMIDMPACLIILLVALVPTLISEKFRKSQGVLLLVGYVSYLIIVCSGILA